MSLSERAILTHLTISVWSGTVGREATEEGLDPARDRVVHSVVPPKMLSAIKEYAGFFRRQHYEFSAPWDDNGLRLVPSQTLFEYTEKMRNCREELDSIAAKIIPRLHEHMDETYKKRFADLKPRFGSRLTFYPVPDGDKLPLIVDTVTAAVRSSIVESMNADAEARSAEICDNLLTTLYKRLKRAETTNDPVAVRSAIEDTTLLVETLIAIDPQYMWTRATQYNQRYIATTIERLGISHERS